MNNQQHELLNLKQTIFEQKRKIQQNERSEYLIENYKETIERNAKEKQELKNRIEQIRQHYTELNDVKDERERENCQLRNKILEKCSIIQNLEKQIHEIKTQILSTRNDQFVAYDNDNEQILPNKKTKIKHMPSSTFIGRYVSNGSANGRPMYMGPKGGIFYINGNENKTYLSNFQKAELIL